MSTCDLSLTVLLGITRGQVSNALKSAKLMLHGSARSPSDEIAGRLSQLGSKTKGHNMFNKVDYPDTSAERNYDGNDVFHQGHGGGFSNDGVPPGPGGTTGAFTGHSMGSKGGPLTFGAGTYFNVFYPEGGTDRGGPCDPGTHGTPGACEECPISKVVFCKSALLARWCYVRVPY